MTNKSETKDEPSVDELVALLDDLLPEPPAPETLIEAVRYGSRRAERMLEAGADPNERDEAGRSVLHVSARYSPRLIGALLEAGADPTARDADGRLPEERATDPEVKAALAAARARAERAVLEGEARPGGDREKPPL